MPTSDSDLKKLLLEARNWIASRVSVKSDGPPALLARIDAALDGPDDMLPEYDFTGGERGKYAARYAKGVVVKP